MDGLAEEMGFTVGRASLLGDGALEDAVVFELFNSTGAGVTGFHYNPVFAISQPEAPAPPKRRRGKSKWGDVFVAVLLFRMHAGWSEPRPTIAVRCNY